MALIGYKLLQGFIHHRTSTLIGSGVTSPVGWLGAWMHATLLGQESPTGMGIGCAVATKLQRQVTLA